MTRNDAIELLPIIKAWSEGNEIEWCDGYGKWHKATIESYLSMFRLKMLRMQLER